MAKKAKPKAAAKVKAKTKTDKAPGVIDTIVSVLEAGGGTVEEIAKKVAAKFPDRDAKGIANTVKIQVGRLQKSKEQGGRGLKIKTEPAKEGGRELRYWT
jgi:hypothetical protein